MQTLLKRVLPVLAPGATVVVIGIGGLGHLAVEYLRRFYYDTITHAHPALDYLISLGERRRVY